MFKKSFRARLMLLVIVPILVVSITLTLVSIMRLTSVIHSDSETQLLNMSYAVREIINSEGSVEKEGDIVTLGGKDISFLNDTFDSITRESGVYVTFFYGDTRYATSVMNGDKRAVGTQASVEVSKKVLSGDEYISLSTKVVDMDCTVAYIPYRDASGNVVGMIFTGVSNSDTEHAIGKSVALFVTMGILLTIVAIIVAFIILNSITNIILSIQSECKDLSNGDFRGSKEVLGVEREDQLGDLARSVKELKLKLKDIISVITTCIDELSSNAISLTSNAQSSTTNISELSNAVEDIANGATTQAEDVQDSTNNVVTILGQIDAMSSSVGNSMALNDDMLSDSKDVVKSFDTLLNDISLSINKLESISNKMRLVSDAVSDVTKASDDIDAIAAQTNLLSLNASIEAARAGEAGRGFAVVAGEIQSLASQSKDSATRIKQIMTTLSTETEEAVGMVNDMSRVMDMQSNSSKDSQKSIEGLISKIDDSKDLATIIANGTDEVRNLCTQLSDAMSSLSAISEENTASTEETSASLQQMSGVISDVDDMAQSLESKANIMKDAISFFKL